MLNKIGLPNVRCEKKYIINEADYKILSGLLSSVMKKDKFANSNNEYYVRSLYFDSIDDKDYKEKQAALEKRQKVRLRIYNLGSDIVKLENKRKYGSFMIKQVSEISYKDAIELIKGDYDCLLRYNNDIVNRIYAELNASNRIPKVIVDYHREAYVEEDMGFRINFDKRISAYNGDDLFSDNLSLVPLQMDNYYVLEVKYSNYLPSYIQAILSSFNLIETTYSKYVYSRINI